MVSSSPSTSPPSSFGPLSPPFFFDHTYSKTSLSVTMPENPSSTEAAAAAVAIPSSHHISSENERLSDNDKNCNCDEKNCESDMLCDIDLDDLDFSLSDFAMDTESSASCSFQEFVDTALSLSSSPESYAARLGHQDTVVLTSHFTSDRITPSTFSSTESRLGKVPGPETSPSSQCFNSIPTKTSSCFEFEAHNSTATCLYSSCQTDQTTLSSSTSGRKLKPGDYLPPLYIDTQSYGVTSFTDPLPLVEDVQSGRQTVACAQSYSMDNKRQQFIDVVDAIPFSTSTASTAATPTAICSDSSCLLTPLSLSDFALSDNQKPSEPEDHTVDRYSGLHSMELNNSELDDSVDDLDMESISDLEKYLTESNLDLNTLTALSSRYSESSIPSTFSSVRPQSDFMSQKEHDQNLPDTWTREKDSDISSVPKLRLSILDGFSSKDELTSWLDGCEFNMAATPPISPCLSPDWRESVNSDTQMKSGQFSKQDTNILDLFSDDNAHAFLNNDSAICQMRVSQFL